MNDVTATTGCSVDSCGTVWTTFTFGYGNHAVRDERWKYIRYRGGGEELYDHRHDPNEWTNLADAAGVGEIKRRLAAWIPKRDARPAAAKAYPNVPPPR